jgi:hypothetical protein
VHLVCAPLRYHSSGDLSTLSFAIWWEFKNLSVCIGPLILQAGSHARAGGRGSV